MIASILSLFIGLAQAESVKTIFNPFSGKLDFITTLSSTTLSSGSTHYIQNQTAAQDNSHFNVSSGNVRGSLTASTVTITGNAFSVGGSSFTISGGSATVAYGLTVNSLVALSTVSVMGQDASGFSIKSSSGIDATNGVVIMKAGAMTSIQKQNGSLFFRSTDDSSSSCLTDRFLSAMYPDGTFTCADAPPPTIPFDPDEVVGNEVTSANNTTLLRSGSGTSGNPYQLRLHLGRANTWSGAHTFESTTTFSADVTLDMNSKLIASSATFTYGITAATGVFTSSLSVTGREFNVGDNEFKVSGGSVTIANRLSVIGRGTIGDVVIGTAATALAQIDTSGVLRFTGGTLGTQGAGYRVGTDEFAFQSDDSPLAGFAFTSLFGGMFQLRNTTGAQVLGIAVNGRAFMGPATAISTFSATGNLNMNQGISLSSGTTIKFWQSGEFSTDVASVAAASTADHAIAVSGLNAKDVCSVNAPALEANLSVTVSSASASVLTLRFNNPSILAVDPGNQTYQYFCTRR